MPPLGRMRAPHLDAGYADGGLAEASLRENLLVHLQYEFSAQDDVMVRYPVHVVAARRALLFALAVAAVMVGVDRVVCQVLGFDGAWRVLIALGLGLTIVGSWTAAMLQRAAAAGPDGKEKFVARQKMGRLGTAEEIAAMAVYLASDESAFTTGVDLVVDGGYML